MAHAPWKKGSPVYPCVHKWRLCPVSIPFRPWSPETRCPYFPSCPGKPAEWNMLETKLQVRNRVEMKNKKTFANHFEFHSRLFSDDIRIHSSCTDFGSWSYMSSPLWVSLKKPKAVSERSVPGATGLLIVAAGPDEPVIILRLVSAGFHCGVIDSVFHLAVESRTCDTKQGIRSCRREADPNNDPIRISGAVEASCETGTVDYKHQTHPFRLILLTSLASGTFHLPREL